MGSLTEDMSMFVTAHVEGLKESAFPPLANNIFVQPYASAFGRMGCTLPV